MIYRRYRYIWHIGNLITELSLKSEYEIKKNVNLGGNVRVVVTSGRNYMQLSLLACLNSPCRGFGIVILKHASFPKLPTFFIIRAHIGGENGSAMSYKVDIIQNSCRFQWEMPERT